MEKNGDRAGADETPGYRSKAEVQIARLLDRHGIAYRYEHPLAVLDRGKVRLWYPDFYLPEYGVIIEYFGLHGNAGYEEQTKRKIEVYENTGMDGLFLTEDWFRGDWPGRILAGIEGILKERVAKFSKCRGRRG